MNRFASVQVLAVLASSMLAGCVERKPSADVFEAIERKDFRESEVRDFVLADPISVSARDNLQQTPLYLLAGRGELSLVVFFLDQGADVNQTGYAGVTPLGSACHSGEFQAAKLLLDRGADPNIADEDGETPLHQIIMWCPDEFELFRLVVDAGGSTNVVTKDGRHLLEFCRDRRKDYESPDYTGSEELRQHLLDSYDRLAEFIVSRSQTKTTPNNAVNGSRRSRRF